MGNKEHKANNGRTWNEVWRLADLKPAAYNPRKELKPGDPEYENIARSIETFGYVDKIIVNRDGTIIGGHQRARVLADMGYDKVEVTVCDLDKAHEKALNVALNKITGEWDDQKLKDLLIDIDKDSLGLEITGFKPDELSDLIDEFDVAPEAIDDDFDPDAAADAIVNPVSKRGMIWQLGRHRLMCGDATRKQDMATLMGTEKADLVITDPPYNVDYEGGTKDHLKIANDNMDDPAFYKFLLDSFSNAADCAHAGAAIYIFYSSTETQNFMQAMQKAGWLYKQTLIWEKNSLVLCRQDYQWRHEQILYGWKEGAAHYFVKDRTNDTIYLDEAADLDSMKKGQLIAWIEDIFRAEEDTTSVIFNKRPTRSAEHPTMKPPELLGKYMINSSQPGWNVLDPFGGSGSTMIAAEQLGRAAFLMELSEKYCDVIVQRWEKFTGKKAVKLSG